MSALVKVLLSLFLTSHRDTEAPCLTNYLSHQPITMECRSMILGTRIWPMHRNCTNKRRLLLLMFQLQHLYLPLNRLKLNLHNQTLLMLSVALINLQHRRQQRPSIMILEVLTCLRCNPNSRVKALISFLQDQQCNPSKWVKIHLLLASHKCPFQLQCWMMAMTTHLKRFNWYNKQKLPSNRDYKLSSLNKTRRVRLNKLASRRENVI